MKSLSRWHTIQATDVYVKAAKAENFRCRSAFKLLQINDSFKIFRGKKRVVDLGAAPGSWSQVATKNVIKDPSTISVLSVDILDFEPVPGTFHLPKTGIEDEAAIVESMISIWGENKPQLVLSDMLHNVSGQHSFDHANSVKLCSNVLKFCFNHLENKGSVVMKIYSGPYENKFIKLMEEYFKHVRRFKPDASRKSSKELYIIAIGFQRHVFDKKYNRPENKDDLSNELN
jgi:23S rRNA (uridine2552-2'-O)-methyltransferase